MAAGCKRHSVENYTIDKRDDASQALTTDWIEWNRLDEDQQYRGRYQVSVKPKGYQQAVTVKLLNLEQAGKPVADPSAMQRYSTEMLNVIAAGLDKNATDAANAAQNRNGSTFDVQSGADDTGLPMLVVRAPFNQTGSVCQQRLKSGHEGDRQHPFNGQHHSDL